MLSRSEIGRMHAASRKLRAYAHRHANILQAVIGYPRGGPPASCFGGIAAWFDMDKSQSTQSFLIRIWHGTDEESGWVGEIKHVQGGEECRFATLGAMLLFLRKHADVSEEPSDPKSERDDGRSGERSD